MAGRANETIIESRIMVLEDVLAEMVAGRIRVPKFHRPFVWSPKQMLKLFESIERGYPIGSLVFWETDRSIPSLDKIANVDIPPPAIAGPVDFVLDGHQRLATLLGALYGPGENRVGSPPRQRDWIWDIYRVLDGSNALSDIFRHWTRGEPPPAVYFPMRSVLRTLDFLAYSRQLREASFETPEILPELLDQAELLARTIKSYQVPVLRLKDGDLRNAIEVFSVLNASGRALTSEEINRARTYRAEGDAPPESGDALYVGSHRPVIPKSAGRLAVVGRFRWTAARNSILSTPTLERR
jgi:Protein of unknown function DUF262